MFSKGDQVQGYDDVLWAAVVKEEVRQEEHIELIASENIVWFFISMILIIKEVTVPVTCSLAKQQQCPIIITEIL